jgi:hypothetical protein
MESRAQKVGSIVGLCTLDVARTSSYRQILPKAMVFCRKNLLNTDNWSVHYRSVAIDRTVWVKEYRVSK